MQAIYDCKRESKIADAARKQDFQENVDGDISAADWIDHDLKDVADTRISSGTTPINIPDDELFFSFDLFAENSTIGASLASNVEDDYAESSTNFPVLFEVPRGTLHSTHLFRLNNVHTLSLKKGTIRKRLEQLPKHWALIWKASTFRIYLELYIHLYLFKTLRQLFTEHRHTILMLD
jgi:hypothetical protein